MLIRAGLRGRSGRLAVRGRAAAEERLSCLVVGAAFSLGVCVGRNCVCVCRGGVLIVFIFV